MARKVKCKICGNLNENTESYKIEKISPKTGKVTNLYYCSRDEYDTYFEEKNRLKELRSDTFTYIHDEILQYGEGILLPHEMVKQLDVLSKTYVWQVIKATFKVTKDNIHYAMRSKNFDSEFVMARYIMVIIKSKLNDVDGMWKRKLMRDSRVKKMETDIVNVETFELSKTVQIKKEVDNGIAHLLGDDDL